MTFVLRMAWRETRAAWARLLFFFFCVAIGVAAIIVIRSVIQSVRSTLTREAREIIGADIVVQSPRPPTDEVRAILNQELAGAELARTEVVQTRTMAAAEKGKGNGKVKLVELRGIETGFPLYGSIALEDGTLTPQLLAGRGVAVTPEFLLEMDLAAGDAVKLGGQRFTIRGVVTKDRIDNGGQAFAFGPRVYLALADLRAIGLLGFGSSANYRTFLKVDERRIDDITSRLKERYRDSIVGVRSWRTFEDRLGQNLVTAENYLSLVGFAMVVLGGIGVWSVTRVLVQQKVKSVAILKCLGATARQVLAVYVIEVLWLTLSGCVLGAGLAAAAVAAIPDRLLAPLGIATVAVTPSAAAQGIAVGILVSLLFALVPLLEMRRVKPLLLLRVDTAGEARRGDVISRLVAVATLGALVLVAIWQSGSLRAGLFVSGGLAAVALLLLGASRFLLWGTAPLARSRWFAVRHAIVSLARPGNQTRVILTSVGLGCFFVLAVRAIQINLVDDFLSQIGATSPDLVLIDVQRDQVEAVQSVSAPYVIEPPRIVPLMRARVAGIEGARVHLPTPQAIREQGTLTREFGITYRDALQANERLTAGRFWNGAAPGPPDPAADAEVSISEEVRDDGEVGVGDLVRLDIAGQVVRARVTSIRHVAWDETQNGGFFFVLRPGPYLARVPSTFVGFVRTGEDAARRAALQRNLVDKFPNVSAIDVRAVVASIRTVLDNITLGISVVGGITVASGVLILIGAVAMTKFQRLYEAAIYRTLGASTRVLTAMVTVEYGVLGLLAGLMGALGAMGLSWALATYLFDIRWRPAAGLLSAGAVATAAVVCVVGLAASVDVLLRKPMATLRE
ncbi:MAG TPA: FtsX-like permease family protein [Vicinamibacterales bacterium]|nr:FtsX-like permease family protein [Vicinamibacterales bacterium]